MSPHPPREPMWICGDCQAKNEPHRTTCRNCQMPRGGTRSVDSTPAYPLYNSAEASARTGGRISRYTFKRLAAAKLVQATYAGRKLLWTDAQIAHVIDYFARGGDASSEPKPTTSSSETSRTRAASAPASQTVTPLKSRESGRFAEFRRAN
ncbi:hypothetical protein FHS43_000536 [Streptosporangium becharense]|uniref:RanBP2-type domain-containing protein n=1 Tax=Streptosporangium becharense TaxID=1816182 RepID=A0A7W9IN49_9ACTN|nr:hypothetical protein [Streptosporangium becharense]MBB2909290.1 hypothetical protein [Streptosporangium becharense]MBB5823807.1 hypothetical protein [Streptosporangium becharense]